jgi:uncharacterized membrane protein YdjX (TVP38/TMEM64 family)
MSKTFRDFFTGGAIVLVFVLAVLAWQSPLISQMRSGMAAQDLSEMVARAGVLGPLLVIGLMMVAVVISPLPSAPIALAAGAAYGHIFGTFYVLVGAEAGALIAFGIARALGRKPLQRWFGEKLDMGLLGSQNALMITVFLSRMMPFISFDLVSYAAGLSKLHFWRFAFATLAGIIPASFLLAHFGGEMASANMARASWAVLGLGLFTGAPVMWLAWRRKKKPRDTE